MDDRRWEWMQLLFHQALAVPAAERLTLLRTAAGNDQELIADVLAMLEEDQHGKSLLDREVAHLAGQMLNPGDATQYPDFGPYRVRRIIGEGGMGVVYLAEREDLGSRVAIKALRDAWMSPSRRERFASEQRTLAQLTHPAIARLYDADTLPDGTPWFAMEYVEGVLLTQYCLQHNSSINQKLRLVRAVSEAVQYAHSHAVIHRDLKPSNILVQPDGTVKLLDFGIAKHLDDRGLPEDQTRTGLRLMTPAYAAPEQVRGDVVGIYTDVYALGVILYELLTGRLPFDLSKRTPGEVDSVIISHEPERPSVAAKQPRRDPSWADLDVLCLTAMHKIPERRYRSVDALIRDIDHYLAGEPLDARPDRFSYRLGKFVRRNGRAVAVSSLILVTLAGLIAFYTASLTSARNAALAEAARTQRLLRFTLNLFNGGDKEAGPASDLRVASLIDRGMIEAASLNREPEVQAEVYQTLGEAYQKLGDLDRADLSLNNALQQRTRLFGGASASAAETQVKLGLLRDDQAKLNEAERLVRDALAVTRRTLPPSHPAVASATHALGKVLEDRGNYDEAIRVLEEAVRLRSAPGADPADLADSLLELANSHFYAGHYPQSESLNRRLLSMHRQLYGEGHPLIAEDLINLGAIQHELGQYQRAEDFERQALAINQAFYGSEHYKTATNLTLIARAVIKQNRNDEGEELLQQALRIQEKVFGDVHPRVASTVNELGTVALSRGHFDEAAADFRRMAAIYRSVYAGKHYLIGIALANLGSVYMAQQDNLRAEPLYREALAMYAQTLPPDHLNVAITRIKLGRTLLRQKRFLEAEVQTRSGYDILSRQANPSVTWLQQARKDLAAIYDALRMPAKTREILAAQAAVAGGTR